jgi:hypothetical protein
MTMFLFLLFLVVLVAFVATRKSAQETKPLVIVPKKVEEVVVPVAEEVKVTKKPRKPRAKKITGKKKN